MAAINQLPNPTPALSSSHAPHRTQSPLYPPMTLAKFQSLRHFQSRGLAVSTVVRQDTSFWTPAPLVKISPAAESLFNITIDVSESAELADSYTKVGQYLQLHLQDPESKPSFLAIASPLSIAASKGIFEFLIKSVAGSTAELLCKLQKGDVVELTPAMGKGFDINKISPPENYQTMVILATGTGISLCLTHHCSPITLFDHESDPFNSDPDLSSLSGKRSIDRDEIRSGTSKRMRTPSVRDYRKDREEWSDTAIACLLEAYGEKFFLQLIKGNLRGRDWEEVSAIVSKRYERQTKSVEQCKNKMDNLKKRFKLERHQMSSGGVLVSHWPWFEQMEQIVGNSASARSATENEKSTGGGGLAYSARQPKGLETVTANPDAQVIRVKKPLADLRWRRVVCKISGGALAGTTPNNIDPKVSMLIASEVLVACRVGIEVAIFIGGSNFFCGDTWVTSIEFDRCTAYQIGHHWRNLVCRCVSRVRFPFRRLLRLIVGSEPFDILKRGRVVIFGGIGTVMGSPLFCTDTVAALKASNIHADAFLKGTNADGVYTYNNIAPEHISFRELSSRGASPMDMMALTLCEENEIPVAILNLQEPENISRALCGEHVSILIDQTGPIS